MNYKMSFIIRGDLLDGNWTHIVHQCNCLTVYPYGLSKSISDQYPYADIYSFRKKLGNRNLATEDTRGIPGTIVVAEPPSNGVIVFNFLAQYEKGKPLKYQNSSIDATSLLDTSENREKWFASCLSVMEMVGIQKYQIKVLAFPDHIGCGLAGGNWEHYKNMIDEFAVRVRSQGTIVCIVLKDNL